MATVAQELTEEVKELQELHDERRDKEQLPMWIKGLLGSIGAFAVATLSLISVFGWAGWSSTQTTFAIAEAVAVTAFLTAVVAHYFPHTPDEPVAVAATFTALVSATIALGGGFGWWSMTQEETSAFIAWITALVGIGGALIARNRVFSALHKNK